VNDHRAHAAGHGNEDRAVDMGATGAAAINGGVYTSCIGEVAIASISGTVSTSYHSGDGYRLHIEGTNGLSVTYRHLAGYIVEQGFVSAGTPVAYIGSTGSITNFQHIHFEVDQNGTRQTYTQWRFGNLSLVPERNIISNGDFAGTIFPDAERIGWRFIAGEAFVHDNQQEKLQLRGQGSVFQDIQYFNIPQGVTFYLEFSVNNTDHEVLDERFFTVVLRNLANPDENFVMHQFRVRKPDVSDNDAKRFSFWGNISEDWSGIKVEFYTQDPSDPLTPHYWTLDNISLAFIEFNHQQEDRFNEYSFSGQLGTRIK